MAQRFVGSINLTDIVAAAKAQHSALNISPKNQKAYLNVTVWIEDEPDEHGNIGKIVLNSTQQGEARDKAANGGKKVYAGNFKYPKSQQQQTPQGSQGSGQQGGYQPQQGSQFDF